MPSTPARNRFWNRLVHALGQGDGSPRTLLAPSIRAGRQWLDFAAGRLGLVAGVSPATPAQLLRRHADPFLAARGLTIASRDQSLDIVAALLAERRASGDAYFARGEPALEPAESLLAAFHDLLRAGVEQLDAPAGLIQPPEKERELSWLFSRFLDRHKALNLALPHDLAQAAVRGLARTPAPRLPVLIAPAFLLDEPPALEKAFFDAWPAERLARIDDEPADEQPAAEAIGRSRAFFRADTVSNEVREVFRRLAAQGTPLDQVEAVCADRDAYDAAFAAAGLEIFGGTPETLPLTFSNGLPASLSRLAREFAAWLDAGETATPDAADGAGNAPLPPAPAFFAEARAFLETLPVSGQFDGYVRRQLLDRIDDAGTRGLWAWHSPRNWLRRELSAIKVMGKAPLPGALHVSGPEGGHAGRPVVFLLGFDDRRFPGGFRQDPVLLDHERRRVSSALPTSASRRRRRVRAWLRLFDRLAGDIVFGFAAASASNRSEASPATFLAEAFENAPKATLCPDRPDHILVARDAALHAFLVARPDPARTPRALRTAYPGLAAGQAALEARLSPAFTEYDGFVPDAGRDWLALPPARQAVSNAMLETLGRNPLAFFFRHVLGIRPPDEEADASRWLSRAEFGNVLHGAFCRYLRRLRDEGRRAEYPGHRPELLDDLREALSEPGRVFGENPLAAPAERAQLEECCAIFLRGEVRRQRSAAPWLAEAALGVSRAGPSAIGEWEKAGFPTSWDPEAPIPVSLPGGEVLWTRGVLDRVDRRTDGRLEIGDYKTGDPGQYGDPFPFSESRAVQPFLYPLMLEAALSKAGRGAGGTVAAFRHIFPTPRAEGLDRVHEFDAERLDQGREVLAGLRRLLAEGTFPFTLDKKDVKDYDAFLAAYGDVDRLVDASEAKTKADPRLAAWKELRRKPTRENGKRR